MIGRKFVGSLEQSCRLRLVVAEVKIGQLPVSLNMVGVQFNTAAECSDCFFVMPLVVEEVSEQVEQLQSIRQPLGSLLKDVDCLRVLIQQGAAASEQKEGFSVFGVGLQRLSSELRRLFGITGFQLINGLLEDGCWVGIRHDVVTSSGCSGG